MLYILDGCNAWPVRIACVRLVQEFSRMNFKYKTNMDENTYLAGTSTK